MADPKSKKQVVNVANFDKLSEEEQDKILDRIIDGFDETDDEDTEDGTPSEDDATESE